MVYVNNGIKKLQSRGIRGNTDQYPTELSFAGSDNTYIGTEESISNEFIQKTVTWEETGNNSKYITTLSSLEAVGSNIQTIGLVGSDDTLITISESFIGAKTNSFNVQVEGEIIIRRPS